MKTTKTSKAILLSNIIMLFIILTANMAHAQSKPDAETRAQKLTEKMADKMSITDTKELQKIQTINLRAARAMDSLTQTAGMNSVMLDRGGKKVDKQRDEALEDVLSMKEWTVYARNKKQIIYAAESIALR